MVWATDKVLNQVVLMLLKATFCDRIVSNGAWASTMDWAMNEWTNRHPNTRPPAYKCVEEVPECFVGNLPPIYEWPEDRQASGV
jgi:hypothetical protein